MLGFTDFSFLNVTVDRFIHFFFELIAQMGLVFLSNGSEVINGHFFVEMAINMIHDRFDQQRFFRQRSKCLVCLYPLAQIHEHFSEA